MVAKARNTQINQRRWGRAGRGGQCWGLHRRGEEGCGHPGTGRGPGRGRGAG